MATDISPVDIFNISGVDIIINRNDVKNKKTGNLCGLPVKNYFRFLLTNQTNKPVKTI